MFSLLEYFSQADGRILATFPGGQELTSMYFQDRKKNTVPHDNCPMFPIFESTNQPEAIFLQHHVPWFPDFGRVFIFC